jgi:leucyl/phenylalanyl-tRNA--protein transferase
VTIDELVAVSSSLDPDEAERYYRLGVFPMPIAGGFGWFYPATRAVIVCGAWPLRCPRSTAQLLRSYRVAIDVEPMEVVRACGETAREGGWIDQSMMLYYQCLKDRGLLHSVEIRSSDEQLVGGLFGVSAGGVFVGESMFHLVTNASKLAFFVLAYLTRELGYRLIDGQWPTEHLLGLGFRTLRGDQYGGLLARVADVKPDPFPRGYLDSDRLKLEIRR